MSLPEGLRAQIPDEPLGSVRTKGKVRFADASGAHRDASIWLVVSATRSFLVAGSGDDRFLVAGAGALAKGWTWDAVQVGRWSAPLRSGTRSVVEKLLAGSTGEGEAIEPTTPSEGRGQVAKGAEIPAWIEAEVPEGPDAVWLYAYETAATQPFPGRDGSPEQRPLWIAVSDRRLWLCAPGGFAAPVQQVSTGGRGLRAQVEVDGRSLPGAVVDRRRDDLLRLTAVEGDARWGAAVENAVRAGDGDRALVLLRDAWSRERFEACWRWLGALAWANGDPDRALAAAFRDSAPLQALEAWELALPTLVLPGDPFASVVLPERPQGWPELTSARAVLATAAVLQDDVEAAWDFWQQGPDALSARAAHQPDAEAWTTAALAWRPSDPERAAEALDRAIELEAPERYRAALWAHEDGRDPVPYWTGAFPDEPPAGFEQPRAAWEGLAAAAADVAPGVATVAWRALGDPPLLWQAVGVLRTLGRSDEAIATLGRLVDVEDFRWRALHALAELHVAGGAPAQAEAALRELVATAFLDVEALDAALVVAEGVVDTATLVRWRHLRAQLDASTAPAPPARDLDATELDGLHPGGVGWLERTRHRLDVAKPPERGQLVRGLEKVEPSAWPDLTARISALAASLGTPVPDVYLFRGEGAWGMSAWPTEPPLLLVGHDHLTDGLQGMDADAQAFALAVELAHLAAKHPLLAFDGGIVGTSRSVYDTFGRYAGAAEAVVDVVSLLPGVDQIAKIQTVMRISRRVFAARSAIDKASDFASSGFDWLRGPEATAVGRTFDGAALQFRLQADRAAWLATGSLRSAIDAILASDPAAASLRPLFREQGVVPVLEATDDAHRLRIAGLLAFAASQ